MRRLRYSIAMFIVAFAALSIVSELALRGDNNARTVWLGQAFVAVVGCCAFLTSRLSRTVALAGAAGATFVFIVIRMAPVEPGWVSVGRSLPLAVTELTGVFICTWAAFRAAGAVAEFEDTIDAIWLPDGEEHPGTLAASRTLIDREVTRARRLESPLTLTVFTFDPRLQRMHLDSMLQEVQQMIVRRFALTKLSRMLAKAVRRTDLVMLDAQRGRFVVLSPDTDLQRVATMTGRIQERANTDYGIDLTCGSVGFPQDGLTFEALLDEATTIAATLPEDTEVIEKQPAHITASDGVRTQARGTRFSHGAIPDTGADRLIPMVTESTTGADA